jgi:hypothetical protein
MTRKESELGKRKVVGKLNLKEKLDEDSLDLSLCTLDSVPVKEIVSWFQISSFQSTRFSIFISFCFFFLKSELSKVRKLNLSFNSLTYLSVSGSLFGFYSTSLILNSSDCRFEGRLCQIAKHQRARFEQEQIALIASQFWPIGQLEEFGLVGQWARLVAT